MNLGKEALGIPASSWYRCLASIGQGEGESRLLSTELLAGDEAKFRKDAKWVGLSEGGKGCGVGAHDSGNVMAPPFGVA